MKKLYIVSLITLCSAIIAGCSENPLQEIEITHEKTFWATIERPDMTRTVIGESTGENSRKVLWLSNDELAVVGESGFRVSRFITLDADSSETASFEGEIEDADNYFALYPYSERVSYENNKFRFYLPTVQSYKAGSFETATFPMVSKIGGEDNTLNFQNLCGVLALNLKGEETISSITFSGKGADGNPMVVSGPFTVDMGYEEFPTMTYALEPDKTTPEISTYHITLNCGVDGVALNGGTETPFYMVLPCGTYSSFSVVIVTTEGEVMYKQGTKPLNIIRSTSTPTSALEYAAIETIDLSAKGTANSYIVSSPGGYEINGGIIGNGAAGLIDSVDFHTQDANISPASADILWQEASTPISNLKYDATTKKISFLYTGTEGNAVIAARDADSTIIWSWHIWCTDQPSEIIYGQEDGVMMDRNLGAVSATPGDPGALGLFYQWGRKDPFRGSSSINDNVLTETTIEWPGRVESNSTNGTIEYSVSNPTTFISVNYTNYDWYYTGETTTNNTRWNSTKTIYDPCPIGWRVPDGGTGNIWEKADFANTYIYDSNLKGYTFFNAQNSWYPLTGYLSYNNANLVSVGYDGGAWSCTPLNDHSAYELQLNPNSRYTSQECTSRGYGQAVRCIKDENYEDITLPDIAFDALTDITATSAKAKATVNTLDNITEKGFVIGTSVHPTIDNYYSKVVNEQDSLTFSSDLTFDAGCIYYIRAYASNINGTTYSEELSFMASDANNPMDLSAYGTANSYIITKAGYYKFKCTVKGHSTESVGTPTGAAVLWETTNTLDAVAKGDIIKSVKVKGDYVEFSTSEEFTPGNALIAVKNNSGTIIWSWHIWVVDFDPIATQQKYISGAVMMDRNLGALNTTKGDARSFGLFYQWGRKDPFIGVGTTDYSSYASTFPTNVISYKETTEALGTVENTIKNPTTFYYYGPDSDWHYPYRDNSLWESEKSIYDPCPSGWRVPDGGGGVWSNIEDGRSTSTNGYVFTLPYSTPAAYYPSAGYMYNGGSISSNESRYWSCSYSGSYSYNLYIYSWNANTTASMNRYYGLPVRCTKDQDITIEITGTHSITDTSAVITGEVTLKEMGVSELLEIGTVISTDQNALDKFRSTTFTAADPAFGTFEIQAVGLSPNVNYYVNVYATDKNGTKYSHAITFKTNVTGGNEGLGNEEYEW